MKLNRPIKEIENRKRKISIKSHSKTQPQSLVTDALDSLALRLAIICMHLDRIRAWIFFFVS